MDPLTQGTLGAALPQSFSRQVHTGAAGLLGFLAGMAPDLDVLIRSAEDPLLFLEYHRQFTHSLVFIPLGGAICALVLHGLLGRRRGLAFHQTWLFCTLGYATHALLDACTTYGTMLLWPFSDQRFAWNTISIIDPLLTLPLLLAVVLAWALRKPGIARVGLVWALCYLGFGLYQRDAAVQMGRELALSRGHTAHGLEAKPSFGNVLLWKTVYADGDRYYVDAVRVTWRPKVYPGDSVLKLDLERDMPWLEANSQQALDVERFRWFSNDYVALDPEHPNRVIDIRYSMLPNEIDPLWSIELSPNAGRWDHVEYVMSRDGGPERAAILWQMLTSP
ncbi:metal-dependent hydrolase [Halioglobus maricola]|uniref:Metal-dependent hydrolase n=1 Tax=Halioglobus maricola TaxID=2601894 RepID=A0A5P9NK38_9GAMM|nr:metal-dependent hydrolase [Halioglobus maricola]QFU76211.1 metal-dependent hydrolase [Halioglobus maricola]